MEYLSRGGGVHPLGGIFMQMGGAQQLSGIFIHMGGGVHHLGGIFIQRGGYTTSVEYLSRGGGGYTTSMEYFSWPPIFPNAPFFHPVPMCCMVSHSSQLSIFMMVFFLVGGCVAGGGGEWQTFPCPFLRRRKEGRGLVPHFYQTFAEMCSILCP